MQALMTGVPFSAVSSTTTGTATGTAFAIPMGYMGEVKYLPIPTGSVSAFSYDLKGSNDGLTFVTLSAAMTTQAALEAASTYRSPILRVDQVSRAGGTSQIVYATLAKL